MRLHENKQLALGGYDSETSDHDDSTHLTWEALASVERQQSEGAFWGS